MRALRGMTISCKKTATCSYLITHYMVKTSQVGFYLCGGTFYNVNYFMVLHFCGTLLIISWFTFLWYSTDHIICKYV